MPLQIKSDQYIYIYTIQKWDPSSTTSAGHKLCKFLQGPCIIASNELPSKYSHNYRYWVTLGPQRGPLVAQHISVLHILHRIQSQPTFFVTITWQLGQCIASPSLTMF